MSPTPRISFRVALFACALSVVSSSARADGMPSYFNPARMQWLLLGEPAQHAVITLDKGYETLLLKVHVPHDTTPAQASQLVWITPVPAAAATVTVDILRGFPTFSGREPVAYLADATLVSLALMAASQIYPIFLAAPLLTLRSGKDVQAPSLLTVHEEVERDGVAVQLVSAGSAQALDSHLRAMGVEFPRAGLQALTSYTGQRACFVLFRIADLAAYRQAMTDNLFALGVEIRFPSEHGFFPLTASAALPTELLEISVSVPEFVEAQVQLPEGMTTHYLVGKPLAEAAATDAAESASPSAPRRFTEFRFLGSPRALTHDLSFRPGAPLVTRIAAVWVASTEFEAVAFLVGMLLFLGLSILAAQCTRFVWPHDSLPSRRSLVTIGAANFFSIVGLFIVAAISARRSGIPIRRAFWFTLATSLVFCVFLALLAMAVAPFAS